MRRIGVFLTAAALLGSTTAYAGTFGALSQCEAALKKATSWHVLMRMADGKTLTMDYAAPHRWRIVPAPGITEVIIGSTVYMDMAGHVMQLPAAYGAKIARTVRIHMFDAATLAQVRRSVRDLGVQTLDGKPVHVYRYVANGQTETWYVGAHNLPVRAVIHDAKGTEVLRYSRYDVPVSIQPPAG